MSVKLVYQDIAVGAETDAAVSATGADAKSTVSLLPAGVVNPDFASLELNHWGGTGAAKVYGGEDVALVSADMSGSDGVFTTPPALTILFDSQYTTLMALNLVTDRTAADYQEWLTLSKIPWADMTAEQRAAWSVPMKGAYNYTDLNRVGIALTSLQTLFTAHGYSVPINARTNWAAGEWPTESEMTAYLQSISNIRSALASFATTPAVPPSMDYGTVAIWNNIEQILADVETLINNMLAAVIYCGEIYSGEAYP